MNSRGICLFNTFRCLKEVFNALLFFLLRPDHSKNPGLLRLLVQEKVVLTDKGVALLLVLMRGFPSALFFTK